MYLSYYLGGDDPTRCCVIGAGGFGRSSILHARHLAANYGLIRPIRAGEPIRLRDVAIDESSRLWKLRQVQDALFFAANMSSTNNFLGSVV